MGPFLRFCLATDVAPLGEHVSDAADLVFVARAKVAKCCSDVAQHLCLIDAWLHCDAVVSELTPAKKH